MVLTHRRSIGLRWKGCGPAVLAVVLQLMSSETAVAGDWPQLLGKNRDGAAVDEKPIAVWKAELKPLWKLPLGAGYSGAVVAEGRVYVAHRQGANDFLDCYPVRGGERVWRFSAAASYSGGVNEDKGPRATPVVDGGQVFFYTATGDLHCLSAKDGAKQWTRKLAADYPFPESYFGVGASPLVLDQSVIVSHGGKSGAAVLSLDRTNGKTLWKAVDDKVSYSSPILTSVKGAPILVACLREKCVGLAPADGSLIFETSFGGRGPSVTGATPVVEKEKLFLSAEYSFGCAMLDLSKKDAAPIWENQDSLTCHYNTPIFYQGHLYGTRGREDYGEGDLRCVDAGNGKVNWEQRGIGVSNAIRVGEQLLLVGIDGQLRLVAASPKSYKLLAEGSLGAGKFRAAPALSEGLLAVRSNLTATTSELRVFDLGAAK